MWTWQADGLGRPGGRPQGRCAPGTDSAEHVAERIDGASERVVRRRAVADDERSRQFGGRAVARVIAGRGATASAVTRPVTGVVVVAELAKPLDRQAGQRGAAHYPGLVGLAQRVPGTRRPLRTASRKADSRPARRRVPRGSSSRSTPELAHVLGI